jgi:protein associated with RNAse G/E
MEGESITVFKLDAQGHEQWRYPATVLARGPNFIRLEALFNRDDMDMGFAVFKRGDRFIETFYDDRWYNVFAVYERDDGALKGWYCNVCRPAKITPTSVRCEDLALDVWITPDGESRILDEDEFAALKLAGPDRAQGWKALRIIVEIGSSGRLPV